MRLNSATIKTRMDFSPLGRDVRLLGNGRFELIHPDGQVEFGCLLGELERQSAKRATLAAIGLWDANDQVTGTTNVSSWKDRSGTYDAAEATNQPALNATGGPDGRASIDFTKANSDKLVVATPTAFRGHTAFSFSAWIRWAGGTGSAQAGIIGLGDYERAFGVLTSTGVLRGFVQAGTTSAVSNSTELVPVDEWAHVVMTYDDAGDRKIRLYINGTAVTHATQTAAVGTIASDAAQTLRIGWCFDAADYFDGRISSVAMYDRVLSAAEIAEIHARQYHQLFT